MSGAHAQEPRRRHSHGRPRTARDGEPGLVTRAARALFSPIPAYGTITIVFLHLAGVVLNMGLAYVVIAQNRAAVAELRDRRPAPVPTVTHTVSPRPRATEETLKP